jgi:DNA-binding beta-propeller fold protein YncE
VRPGQEKSLSADVAAAVASEGPSPDGTRCGPTWAQVSPDEKWLYVACNKNREILEIDLDLWTVARRFPTGAGPYNLDVSPDGRLLVATFKGDQATGIFDLQSGDLKATVENTRRLPHGVVISPDSRYAFVSVEGVGGEPGTVDVIDLVKTSRVASVELGKQAGGIGFWKQEAAGSI